MLDLRVEPVEKMKELNIGDHYLDYEGIEYVVNHVDKDEKGNVLGVGAVSV